MSKDIIDYLHFYLGCEVFGTYNDQSGSKGFLTGVTNGGHECEIQFFLEDGINVSEEPEYNLVSEIKPILRKLESMTEDEAKVLAEFYSEWAWRKSFEVTSLDLAGASVFITIYYQLEGAPHGIGDGEYTEQLIISKDTIWARSYSERNNFKIVLNSHKMTHYLLSRGFDLFNLIESGLAIDKETLKG